MKKLKKAMIISILLGMSLSTVSASAEVIRDFEYDP